jgi:hypothetical protein
MFPTQRHVKTGICCFETTEARMFRKNQVSFGAAITLPYVGNTFGWQIGCSRDRYNRNYLSLSRTAGKTWIIPVSLSLTANKLNRIAPTFSTLDNFLTGFGRNFSLGGGPGINLSWTPGVGASTGAGVMAPQIGVSAGLGYQFGN